MVNCGGNSLQPNPNLHWNSQANLPAVHLAQVRRLGYLSPYLMSHASHHFGVTWICISKIASVNLSRSV